jgi:hypothetical protein
MSWPRLQCVRYEECLTAWLWTKGGGYDRYNRYDRPPAPYPSPSVTAAPPPSPPTQRHHGILSQKGKTGSGLSIRCSLWLKCSNCPCCRVQHTHHRCCFDHRPVSTCRLTFKATITSSSTPNPRCHVNVALVISQFLICMFIFIHTASEQHVSIRGRYSRPRPEEPSMELPSTRTGRTSPLPFVPPQSRNMWLAVR